MKARSSGSVRIDLVGGTLDLWPICVIVPEVITINMATSLQAEVEIELRSDQKVVIYSRDYQTEKTYDLADFNASNFNSQFFEHFQLVAELIGDFTWDQGLSISLKSGSPTGAGLGGSSTMGVVLYSALLNLKEMVLEKKEIVTRVAQKEARILKCGPTGYQDYFPALYKGVLALHAKDYLPEVEQCYSRELADFLESHMTLIYSGETRLSGITNWEVFKSFFDHEPNVSSGLVQIASNAKQAYQFLKDKKYLEFLKCVAMDGNIRTELFPNFTTSSMIEFASSWKNDPSFIGYKVCGAGGGGCFIMLHEPELRDQIIKKVQEKKMEVLEFFINH